MKKGVIKIEYCHIVEQDEIAYGDNYQIFEFTCILFIALFFYLTLYPLVQ